MPAIRFRSALASIGLALVSASCWAAPASIAGTGVRIATGITNGWDIPSGSATDPKDARKEFLDSLKSFSTEEFKFVSGPPDPTGPFGAAVFSGAAVLKNPQTGTITNDTGGSTQTGRFDTTFSQLYSAGPPEFGPPPGYWYETDEPDQPTTVTFKDAAGNLNPTGHRAFGLYVTDLGDFGATLSITASAAGQSVFTKQGLSPSVSANGSVLFFGFYTDFEFDTVSFKIVQGQGCAPTAVAIGQCERLDVVGFDSMIVGDWEQTERVPTPGSLALLGAGLLVLSWRQRRSA